MMEQRAVYRVKQTCTVSVIPETDWEGRLCEIVRLLRSQKKDAIIFYDQRTNTLRVAPFVQVQSLKAE